MPIKDVLSDEEISHALNERLLGEAEEIKSERRTLKERLDKLDETRESVSTSVYQKVRADYNAKLSKTTERLIALKKELEGEEGHLAGKKTAVEANIRYHREKIEESSLRHSLGEFTSEQHKELIEREQKEIERLEVSLKSLGEGLQRHREIFEGETLPAPQPVREPESAAAIKPPPQRKPEPSVSDSTAKIRLETAAPQHEAPEVSGSTERSQSAPRKASELVVLENGKVIQTVPLDHTIVIGRSPASDVVLKEPKVSRKHAEIQFVGGRYVLLDLESSNGTYVGGKRVSEQVLQPNDEITVGNTKMVFKG